MRRTFVVGRVAVLGAVEAVDPLLVGGERDAMAGLASLDRQAIDKWVLPVPRGRKKQTLLCSAIQASWARCRISGFLASGWAVKVGQPLVGRRRLDLRAHAHSSVSSHAGTSPTGDE
jgi:hypothetical protein